MDFSTLAYAKLNLEFDQELFANEYDLHILPHSKPIANGQASIDGTVELNKIWGMIDPNIYNLCDTYTQPKDSRTLRYIKRNYPAWQMFQLMQLDTKGISDPYLLQNASFGGAGLRNESLDKTFHLKDGFDQLEITKWIFKNLPFKKINSIHCVSIEPTGFSTIHRDMKRLYNNDTSAGVNKVYRNGFVIINLNISNGGVPLYWSLDGTDAVDYQTTDEQVYLCNDYFFHGVPVCSSRRRQIRVTGIPKDSLWNLIDQKTVVDIGQDYQYDPSYPG